MNDAVAPLLMKILFVSARGDAFGGASRHVRDMARRLMDDGHEVRILVGGSSDMEVPRRFKERGLDYRCIVMMGRKIDPWRDLRSVAELRRQIRQFQPDLVSTHASKGGALGRLACLGLSIPVIYTPHCWSFVDGFPKARFYRRIERWMARITTKIVAVCEDERRFGLVNGIGSEENTVAIHNGVAIDSGSMLRGAEPRQGDGSPRLLMVGRFEKQKDQSLLLHALARLADLPWSLKFVGDGPSRPACMDLVVRLGLGERVEFAGYSNCVDDHLAECDIFALISLWEGFPRSILEAMAAGLPVVASDVGGCRESVLDGKTGRLVRKGDEGELASVLRELIVDSRMRDRMGSNARRHYLTNFTFEQMYQTYRSFYESLTGLAFASERRSQAGAGSAKNLHPDGCGEANA